MPPVEPITLTNDDLYSPRVDGYLEAQSVLTRQMPQAEPQPALLRVLYSSCFYLAMAGMVGALGAWAIIEPYFAQAEASGNEGDTIAEYLLFPSVMGGVGFLLGAVEGAVCRNLMRAVISSLVGLGIGFVVGAVAIVAAGAVFLMMVAMAVTVGPPRAGELVPSGFGFVILMMGRGAAWSIAAIAAGLGQGIALRDRKVVINGVVGGVLGGLLGGMLFDPIYVLLGASDGATLSRGVGFAVIGLMVGLFIGLVEHWTKTAWLLMRAGPLAGKQFILFRTTTVIGSSPKCDVYLFKDAAIEPRHALIHDRGGRYEIEDTGSADGTYVNGRPIRKQMLCAGDQIVIGKTLLEFALKDKE